MKESYREILREYQANDRVFTLLEAIELLCQFNLNIFEMDKFRDVFANIDLDNVNTEDKVIPTRNTVIPFPDLKIELGEESGLYRTSPFFPINPFDPIIAMFLKLIYLFIYLFIY